MRRYLISEPAEAILAALGDALDLVDFGIVLLNSDLRARFVSRRFFEIWNIDPATVMGPLTFRELLDRAASNNRYDMPAAEVPTYLTEREAEVRAGSVSRVIVRLADRRHILFRCMACPDGGRILTYLDISRELRRESDDAVARTNAELRFNSEVMEEQGAYLAALAEAAEENAQKAESARLQLEHEIGERRQLETKLRRLATTDGLTGVLNRAEFLASAQRVLEANRLVAQTVAVLMLDVDHFKAVNDRFGHAGGDRALQHLVATLGAGVRQIDILGRVGGEEFAVALPDTPLASAERVAEQLRARVAKVPIISGDRMIRMTISIGIAVQLETDRSIEQVIARADDALYRAKNNGRNRVERYQEPDAA
jgi:diguanylate cyclase (GGDEF)-like protein